MLMQSSTVPVLCTVTLTHCKYVRQRVKAEHRGTSMLMALLVCSQGCHGLCCAAGSGPVQHLPAGTMLGNDASMHHVTCTRHSQCNTACQGSVNGEGAAVTVFLLQDETVNEIAKKLDKTATQVILRWGLQHGSSVLPKSSDSDHLQVCTCCASCNLLLVHVEGKCFTRYWSLGLLLADKYVQANVLL